MANPNDNQEVPVTTAASAEMTSETPFPEPLRPGNGLPGSHPITPAECKVLQDTIAAQSREFTSLRNSIDPLRDSIDLLTQEMHLFRESLTSILARWADMTLVQHQQQLQREPK